MRKPPPEQPELLVLGNLLGLGESQLQLLPFATTINNHPSKRGENDYKGGVVCLRFKSRGRANSAWIVVSYRS